MNEVFCPFCSTSQSLQHAAAGQTARCKSCGKTFMVPVAPAPRATTANRRLPTAAPLPAAALQASPLPRASSAAARPATLGAAMAPLSVAGGVPPTESLEPAAPEDSGGSSIGLILLGGTACFVLGGLLLLVVILRLSKEPREPDRPAVAGTGSPAASRIVKWTPENSRSSGWTSVARGVAIDLNSLAVDVQAVDFGEVRAKDAYNRVIVSDQRNYLQIYLKIKNLGSRPVKYVSWQGNSFAAGGQEVRATLVDDQGRSYAMQEFAHVAGLKGHTPSALLAPKEEAQDVVVFAIPESVAHRTIGHFRLELPAEAYGGSGVYRFEIQRQSVQGF